MQCILHRVENFNDENQGNTFVPIITHKNISNMKKTILLMILLSFATLTCVNAQQGEIIYRDFEPDTTMHGGYEPRDIWIDFDNDNLPDIKLYWIVESPEIVIGLVGRDQNVKICQAVEGDTVSHLTEWMIGTSNVRFNENWAIRIEKNGEYYYGWFRTYFVTVFIEPMNHFYFHLDKYAYCTIPDYPLCWGQTSLTEGIDETGANAFATVHPNPTNGIVTITGENLRQAEVANMLGQQMLSVNGNGNELHIDLTALPAGVYFVNVTDEEGRKCVRKVVKE